MSYFVVLIFMLMLGIDLSYVFKRGFGQTAAIANFILILLLYIGGLFANMRITMYVFLALDSLLTAFVVYRVIRTRELSEIKSVILNPAFCLYTLLGIALGVAFLEFFPNATDEMTHWALCVKNMFEYDNFGNIGNTTTMFNQYVPATGIFMYAFQIFSTKFSCGALYAAFDMLLISMLLPIMEMFNKKLSIPCIVSTALAFVLCIIFKNNILSNLLVDGILGVMMAYIYLAYRVDRNKMSGFTLVSIGLGCFVVTMTKSSGIALAIFALIFIVVEMLTVGREQTKLFFKKKINIAYVFVPVVLIAFAKLSWSLYINIYSVRAGWDASEMNLPNVLEWFKNPTPYQSEVTSLFFKNFFVGNFKYEGGLQVPALLTLLLIAGACVGLGFKTKNKIYAISQGVVSCIILIGYAVSLLLLYIFSFAYWEGRSLASYARYSMTILLAFSLICLYQFAGLFAVPWSEKDILPKSVSDRVRPFVHPVYIAVVGIVSIGIAIGGYFNNAKSASKQNAEFSAWIQAIETLDKNDSVYIVVSDEGIWPQALTYIKMRFIATPIQTSGYLEGGSYTDGRDADVCYTGNPFSMNVTIEELTNCISKYTHIYLQDVWDEFEEKFGELFIDEIEDDTLYEIIQVDGQTRLVMA
ncbi:MAG: hypothetical protein K2J16_01125 [Clostridia bacterium]|nr:hypothetical protein [Clostridia bacterium]